MMKKVPTYLNLTIGRVKYYFKRLVAVLNSHSMSQDLSDAEIELILKPSDSTAVLALEKYGARLSSICIERQHYSLLNVNNERKSN